MPLPHRLRRFALALLVVLTPTATPAPEPAAPMSIAELMQATALDETFTQLGASIETVPDAQGLPMSDAMRDAWSLAARQSFEPAAMNAEIASRLEGAFTTDELAAYEAFYDSAFGVRVVGLERAVMAIPPEGQASVLEEGLALAAAADAHRSAQIEELLDLAHAELASDIVGHSARAMLLGMSLSGMQGDIEVSWEDIEAQLDLLMPQLETELAATQRALVFFTYRDLGEADLDAYLEFLRTEPARKLFAITVVTAGDVLAASMKAFGERLATALDRVAA